MGGMIGSGRGGKRRDGGRKMRGAMLLGKRRAGVLHARLKKKDRRRKTEGGR